VIGEIINETIEEMVNVIPVQNESALELATLDFATHELDTANLAL
jgi:hypothetical protein